MRYNFTDTFAQKFRRKKAQRIYLFCTREDAAGRRQQPGRKRVKWWRPFSMPKKTRAINEARRGLGRATITCAK
jgi:hypothetical protein